MTDSHYNYLIDNYMGFVWLTHTDAQPMLYTNENL